MKKEKISYAEVAKICGEKESASHAIVKKRKEIRAPQTAEVPATVCDESLVSMEKDCICGWKTGTEDVL